MRSFVLVAALAAGTAASAAGQITPQQPTEKLLIVPLPVTGGADSLTSLRVMDLARERLDRMARYRVQVIPKTKICEAMSASGFPCDVLMDQQQARQLARFLDADAYITGVIAKEGTSLVAHLRVVDVGGSGLSYSFAARNGNPGTAEELAEQIAQRMSALIRAAERSRDCEEQRRLGRFPRAIEAARKALELEPNLPSGHLCIATIHEAQRMPADSVIRASQRALAGDSLNTHALETIARQYQIKGDTATALQWFERLVRADPSNKGILLGLVTQLQLRKEYARAEQLLREGLHQFPGDQQLSDRRYQVCIEGGLWGCVLEGVNERVSRDSIQLADTALLKIAIGAAQQKPDTTALCRYTQAAVRHHPREISFLKTRGTCFEWLAQPDSAIARYIQAYQADTTDVATALLIAKTVIESATYDTTGGGRDSTLLPPRRAALADRVEMARPFLNRGLASPDTAIRINATVMMLTAGSKLAQAAAYDRAYPWLEQLLLLVAPRGAADSIGPRHQIRMNASFWYAVASTITLRTVLQEVIDKKSCPLAAQVAERMRKTRDAAQLGRRVHEPTMRQMTGILDRYETPMRQVKEAYKCRNF